MKAKDRHIQQFLIDNQKNHLYRGDCLSVLDRIEDNSVDLIYIDPPFYSQRYYERIWGEDVEKFAFEDRWRGGIQTYLNYLAERTRKLHEKLTPTGNIYVHLDWHIVHYFKVEMDKICGYNNFLNEIIWCYETGGRATSSFPKKHDTILRYGKSKNANFYYDNIALPRDFSTMHETVQTDLDGRKYQRNIKAGKEYRYYNDRGVLPNDWWIDIQALNPAAKERLGYPTQKPLALLERIVNAATQPGNLVLDAFCGCGTTLEAAQRLGRRWIGIDISQSALRVVQNRLKKIGVPAAETHNMVQTVDELRELSWQEFQAWAVDAVQGRHSPRKIADMGIDGFTFLEHHPIQVKQMESVGRPVIDNFVGVLARERESKGMVIGISFTKGAIAEVARLEREDKITIDLVTCKQILEEDLPFRTIA
jgi:DNA modification methylase